MNKIIAVIAIVFAFTLGTIFSADIATALKPATEVFVTNDATNPIPITGSISSNLACPAENVQHWVTGNLNPNILVQHDTLQDLLGSQSVVLTASVSPLDVIPNSVMETLEFWEDVLNDRGYFVADPTPRPVSFLDITGASLLEVFSTICAE